MIRTALYIFSIIFLLTSGNFGQKVETLVQGPSTFNDGLAIDKSGNIYASRYYSSTVTKITPDGNTEIFANGFSDPNGLAIGPDGNLYVTNAGGGRIDMVTPDGEKSTVISGLTNPTGVAFDSNGKMIIAHYQTSKLSSYEAGSEVETFMTGNGLNGPVGIVFDENDNLYIGNFNNGKVLRRTPDGTVSEIGDLPGWLGFITYSNGYVYATAFQRNRIYKIGADGSGQEVFAGSGYAGKRDGDLLAATFDGPNGIVASSTGDTLFISDFESRSLRMITGINPQPSITSVDSIDFGEVEINTAVIKSLVFTNDGSADLEISEIATSDSQFEISQKSGVIKPGDLLEVNITFTPIAEGSVTESLVITSNIGTKEILLIGTGRSVVSVKESDGVARGFLVMQNYPNPFNPETIIRFHIPEASHVSLNVYNALGQEVKSLISGFTSAGWRTVSFNAGELSSGIYIYKLSGSGFTESRQMLLLK